MSSWVHNESLLLEGYLLRLPAGSDAVIEHRIISVSLTAWECPQCGSTTPHNVIAYCACGKNATGVSSHIWTITRKERAYPDASTFPSDSLVWLSPSFNWLNDPKDPSKGSHLHESISGVLVEGLH
jgi:hypothetical protein